MGRFTQEGPACTGEYSTLLAYRGGARLLLGSGDYAISFAELCKDRYGCFSGRNQCDCKKQCRDGSDETGCEGKCHLCKDNSTIYSERQKCDCRKDCEGGEDEVNCKNKAGFSEHFCGDGTCQRNIRYFEKFHEFTVPYSLV